MHHATPQRFRVLATSLLIGILSILAAAATVLADGGGGAYPH